MKKLLTGLVLFFITTFGAIGSENYSNKIDVIIANQLKRQRQEMPKPISDEKFIRRAYIDILGRIPTYDEGQSLTSRKELIDNLLDSKGYTENMFNFWADLLRIKKRLSNNYLWATRSWKICSSQNPLTKFWIKIYQLWRNVSP